MNDDGYECNCFVQLLNDDEREHSFSFGPFSIACNILWNRALIQTIVFSFPCILIDNKPEETEIERNPFEEFSYVQRTLLLLQNEPFSRLRKRGNGKICSCTLSSVH